ncbi:MAG: glycosyltransferase [Ruminococcus sp.]|jgi:glycosyltransferase involved in cell wall biosynthesis|nr:glycosyltransferase [Ruminococcus sp.]
MNTLSIGIIVKNEEKKLTLCLDSLETLRKAVDCKVIIADTGSSDDTKKIAEKRADVFFEHAWNTDFSEARNAIFEKVDSEWFMYIDADEILPENNDLAEFFISGDYKNYDCASVDIHTAINNNNYEHFSNSIRLVKFTPETRFVGKINETFAEIPKNCKFLKITLEHSGYLQAVIRAKELRNVAMCRIAAPDCETPETKIRLDLTLFDSLCKYDIFEAEKAWDDGLRLSDNADPYYKSALYIRKMQYHYTENEYDKTLELHEDYKKLRGADYGDIKKLLYTDIEDAFITGATAARSDDYDTAVKMLTNFEEYYRIFNENYERFAVNRRIYPAICTSDNAVKLAASMLTASCMKSKQYEYALLRLMKNPVLSNDINICMDNINDFSRLPEFLTIPGAAAALTEYIPTAVHPIDLTKALTELVGEDSDFAIIYRYLTEPFDCEIESLHAKKIVIEYLTKTKSEPDDLEFLVNDYIDHVYVTSDSIHYSDLITSARRVLAEKSENKGDI